MRSGRVWPVVHVEEWSSSVAKGTRRLCRGAMQLTAAGLECFCSGRTALGDGCSRRWRRRALVTCALGDRLEKG